MKRHDLPDNGWSRSTYSEDNGGQCLEVRQTPQGLVAVRDSKNPQLGVQAFAAAHWQRFIAAVTDGSV
jgi:hypothetical protein